MFTVFKSTAKVFPWIFVLCRMALFKYFKHKEGSSAVVSNNLPDENGPLCTEIPFSSIWEANLGISCDWKTWGKVFLVLEDIWIVESADSKVRNWKWNRHCFSTFCKRLPRWFIKGKYSEGMEKRIPQRTGKKEEKWRKIVGEITTLCQEREASYAGINSRQAGTRIFDSYLRGRWSSQFRSSYSSCDGYCLKTGQQSISPKWWSHCSNQRLRL